MRHFRASGTIPALTFGMRAPTRRAVLIATSGRPHRASTCLLRTVRATVALTPIAVAANHHRLGATRAVIASSRIHGLKRADGECCGDLRSVGYFAQQRRPLGLRGATSDVLDGLYRCRACLSTGQALFYRIGTATASPGSTTPSEQSLGGARIPRPPTPSPPLNPLTGSDPSLTRRNHATNPSTPDLCGITQPLTI